MLQTFKTNKILSAYGTSLLGIASGLLTSFWLLREITKVIPPQDFGVYAYVVQICAYLPILQLGVDFAATRHIAQSLGRNAANEANSFFADLLIFNRWVVVLGIGVLALLSAVFWYSPSLFGAPDNRVAHLSSEICLAAGFGQLISFMSRPYSAALVASSCQATANTAIVVRTISTTIIAFCLLRFGFYVFSVPMAEITTQFLNYFVLRSLANARCTWRLTENGVTTIARSDRRAMMSLIKFGAMTTLGGVAWTLESGVDVLILANLTTPQVVATYVIWWRAPQMLFDLCTRLSFSAFPSLSHNLGVSKRSASVLLGKLGDSISGLATLAFVGVSIWLPSFVQIWIGTSYAPQDSVYLPFLMGMLVCLRTSGNLLGIFWLALGRTGFGAALGWCQGISKLCLALWLVPKFGISGLILASCVASALQVVVTGLHLYRSEMLNIGPVVRFTSLFVLAIGLAFFAGMYTPHANWKVLGLGAIVTTICWGTIWFAIAWTGDLRATFRSLLASARQLRPT